MVANWCFIDLSFSVIPEHLYVVMLDEMRLLWLSKQYMSLIGSSGARAKRQTFSQDLQLWQLVTLEAFNLHILNLQYWKN